MAGAARRTPRRSCSGGDAERTAEELRAPLGRRRRRLSRGSTPTCATLAGFVAEVQTTTPPGSTGPPLGDAAGRPAARPRLPRASAPEPARELTRVLPMAVGRPRRRVVRRRRRARPRWPPAARRSPRWGRGRREPRSCCSNDSAGNDGGAAGRDARSSRGGPTALAARAGARPRATRASRSAPRPRWRGCCTDDGRVAGVRLATASRSAAPVVACAVDPKTVLTSWIDPVVAGPQLRWRAGQHPHARRAPPGST